LQHWALHSCSSYRVARRDQVNPPITKTDPNSGYRFSVRYQQFKDKENLVILAFSGGGTRAAAFSYGVLEFLRRTEVVGPKGNKFRLLDEVDIITGVSGGSFTALAYGLYGDKLFADYEQRFLKRNVQGELIGRFLSPAYWGDLWSQGWGRSELAAQLYDEILFNGATFADLDRGNGPLILASATDISTGARFVFNQNIFDVLCSDLNAVRLSRAAAASSAVPVILSSITVNNYGGTCNTVLPPWVKLFTDSANPPRPATRALREIREAEAYGDGARRPYIHLVDGGVSDNVGMRSVLDALQLLESLHDIGVATTARQCAQDHRFRRQLAFVPADALGRIGDAPRHGGHPPEGHGCPHRSLLL
jgi:NTE family protein